MASTLADRSPLPRRLTTQRKKRRGIVLLMVVSLLALFLLMGVTFAILAIQYKHAAEVAGGVDRYGDKPMAEMEAALGMVLFDANGRSSLRGHSFLRDMYGTDYVHTTLSAAPLTDNRKTVNNHFVVFPMSTTTITGAAANVPGFYNGRVITFITGPAAGISSRVAGYEPIDPATNQTEVYIEPLLGPSGVRVTPASGDQFVINGAPFNGMGFGYDPETRRLDAVDDVNRRPVVLLPHYAGYERQQVVSMSGSLTMAPDVGGADEPYDSAGPQDVQLAVVPPGLIASQVAGSSNRYSVPLIPSYMPSALLNYWLQSSRWPGGNVQLASNAGQRDLARQIIFRPMPWDHRNFTGSNPDLTPATNDDNGYRTLIQLLAQQGAAGSNPYWEAIWDVDNDGDGVRDSVWVDAGLPVMTDKSGRRYKRLFAILIKDLDGRINLNVHGNLGQTNVNATNSINYPFPVFGPGAQPATANFPLNKNGALGAVGSLQLPRGMGFGPAEVDFRQVLNIASLTAEYGTLLTSRYGNDGVPGAAGDDGLSAVKMAGVPANYLNDSWYGSVPDVWGRNAVSVDFGGRPFAFRESITATGETIDDPYEMEWDSRTAINDTPYTPGDMESLARANDNDITGFPMRLPSVSPNLFTGAGQPSASNGTYQRVRESFTTMSSSVPTVPGIFRYEDRQFHGTNSTIAATDVPTVINLYRRKLAANGITGAAQVRAQLAKIMPWEFWQGKPLDLNRYLSNGVNDNSGTNNANGEAAEALANEPAFGTNGNVPSSGTLPAGFSGTRGYHANSIDVDGDGNQDGTAAATNDRRYARHLMARHLYCLMLLMKDDTYNPQTVSGNQSATTTARLFAQWAVNIVDFRDPDGIMTGFEYDTNPWNGWTTDGDLSTTGEAERGIVWGCEAPELLMTEAIAFHDRRVKDTKFDTTGKERNETQMPDDDVDQFRVPQGTLVFEMYCPRTHTVYNPSAAGGEAIYNPHMPFELYDRSTGKLALDRTVAGGNPVWQVAVARMRRNSQNRGLPNTAYVRDQNNFDNAGYFDPVSTPGITTQPSYNLQYDSANLGQTVEIERYVWFTSAAPATAKANRVFYNKKGWNAQLSPGQYMVVGPREQTHLGSNRIDAGGGSGFWFGDSPQHIYLSDTAGVEITDAMGNRTSKLTTPPGAAEIQPVLPMVAMMSPPSTWSAAKLNDDDRWVGLNVSEPLPQPEAGKAPYYTEYNTTNDGRNPFDAYDDPAGPMNVLPDAPQDNTNGRPIGQENMQETNIYRDASAVFLQRLADPTSAWDPLTNPYITVDFAPVDVSVFTGEEDTNRTFKRDPNDPASPDLPIDPQDPPPGGSRLQNFATGQRAPARGNMWFPIFTNTQLNPAPQTSTERYFRLGMHHTLGYINEDVGTPRDSASSGGSSSYVGDPTNADKPFPWITWNNRPYMNAAELLFVPTSAPNRLVLEISPDHPLIPNVPNPNPYAANNATQLRQPFAHLMNMFQSGNPATPNTSMNLVRMLDYVEVPSNFVGAERWYNPTALANTDSPPPTPPTLRPEYTPPYLYRPPFNKLSRFRDPGKPNINTIYDPAIWNSIVGYDATTVSGLNGVRTPAIDEIFRSRQGYTGSIGQMNNNYPTIFANPFRPADMADLMPDAQDMRTHSPAEVSLFRPSAVRPGEPLFGHQSSINPNDTDRHAYFRYQGLQKLSNIVGTQSNCYAVWVTVGYFEVEDNPNSGTAPNGIDVGHPDGFQLGQELDIDNGSSQRHRSFFLIDRSIPAGFIPGLKLNTDNCILLKRQID